MQIPERWLTIMLIAGTNKGTFARKKSSGRVNRTLLVVKEIVMIA